MTQSRHCDSQEQRGPSQRASTTNGHPSNRSSSSGGRSNPPKRRQQNGHFSKRSSSNGFEYSPYWNAAEIEEKLKKGQCFSGVLRINATKQSGEGYVSLPGLPNDVMIRKGSHMNRSIAGDTIVFRILATPQWWIHNGTPTRTEPAEIADLNGDALNGTFRRKTLLTRSILEAFQKRKDPVQSKVQLPAFWDHVDSAEEAKDLLNEVIRHFPELRPTAEVVGILSPSFRRAGFVGFLRRDPSMQNGLLFYPLDPAMPTIFRTFFPEGQDWKELLEESSIAQKEQRTMVHAEFLHWNDKDAFPTATILKVIGRAGDIVDETKAILISNDVQDAPFSDNVMDCVPSEAWNPSENDLTGRWDFRDRCVFSIDPKSARDLDDALSIEKVDSERFKVGVHIADVSHFVKASTELDKEARHRGTSVYLVHRAIPMLPEILSSRLCSLNPGEDRLTFSVVWEMDHKGNVLKQEMKKSVIRSCARMAYAHAQSIIDDPQKAECENEIHDGHSWDEVKESVQYLYDIAKELRAKRFENGALRLDLPKVGFVLNENGLPEKAHFVHRSEANFLIEEFMLLANMTVAKRISDTYPLHALLRLHPAPNPRQLDELKVVAAEMGIFLDTSTAASIQRGLRKLYETCKDVDRIDTITNIATKPMQLAEYFCTGMVERQKWRHYALATDCYTHFTSPIRRYADIIVHRLLEAAITNGTSLEEDWGREETLRMQNIAGDCNRKKLGARNVQDAVSNLFLKHWLEKNPVETVGLVAAVKGPKFFDLYVPQFALTTKVICEEFPKGRRAVFDKNTSLLTIRRIEPIQTANGTHPKSDATKDEDQKALLHFVYQGDRVLVQLEVKHLPKASASPSRPPLIRLDFSFCEDRVSADLISLESLSGDLGKPTSSERSEKESMSVRSITDPCLRSFGTSGEDIPPPLQIPCHLGRFSRVPVKVSVKRCETFGKLQDIKVELIFADL